MRHIFRILLAASLANIISCAPLDSPSTKGDDANPLLVAIGFYTDFRDFVSTVDIITPANNSHGNGTNPPTLLHHFGSAIGPNNTIYVLGSFDPDHTGTFLSYNVRSDTWNTLARFPVHISESTVAIVGNKILSMGGADDVHALTDVYTLDLNAQGNEQAWAKLPTQLPIQADSICAIVTNGSSTLYLLDETGNLFRSTDVAQTWTQLKSLKIPEYGLPFASCAALNDETFVVAGGHGVASTVSTASVYDVAKDEWHDIAPMNKDREGAQAVVLPSSAGGKPQVVVCGGGDSYGVPSNDCEKFDLDANKWSPAGFSLKNKMAHFGLYATVLNEKSFV